MSRLPDPFSLLDFRALRSTSLDFSSWNLHLFYRAEEMSSNIMHVNRFYLLILLSQALYN